MPIKLPKAKLTKADKLDVDIRFLLANERTLLAWVRTGLTLLAGGLALLQFADNNRYIGISLALTGALAAVIGYIRWRAADQAIRSGHLPKAGIGPVVQVAVVLALTAGLLVLYS